MLENIQKLLENNQKLLDNVRNCYKMLEIVREYSEIVSIKAPTRTPWVIFRESPSTNEPRTERGGKARGRPLHGLPIPVCAAYHDAEQRPPSRGLFYDIASQRPYLTPEKSKL